jgi:hypothetical protein
MTTKTIFYETFVNTKVVDNFVSFQKVQEHKNPSLYEGDMIKIPNWTEKILNKTR